MKIKTKTLFENIVAICIILDCESVWKWMLSLGIDTVFCGVLDSTIAKRWCCS